MTDELRTIWQADGKPDSFTRPEDLMNRSSAFERKVRIRNIAEYAAGAIVIAGACWMAAMFVGMGELAMAGAMVLTVLGACAVMWNLHARASAEKRRPEEDCRAHLIAQHRRQADALRKVPLWYIGPLLPGVLGVYGTVAIKAIGVEPWSEILANIGGPLAATLGFFGFVIWLNLRAAHSLQKQADALAAA